MNSLFNSTFEVELRTLLLLSKNKSSPISLDRIIALDFITCYAEDFQIPYENLHGENSFMYSELAARKVLFREGIKKAVVDGLVTPVIDNGYKFLLNDVGKKYTNALKSTYAKNYKEIVAEVHKSFKNYSDEELDSLIYDNAQKSAKRV